ncbi:hypothetical protein D1864_07675 [Oceanobacillus picturae]|nr:hypothetical protein D1864_07675 [Oceanobacillus picturae]
MTEKASLNHNDGQAFIHKKAVYLALSRHAVMNDIKIGLVDSCVQCNNASGMLINVINISVDNVVNDSVNKYPHVIHNL